VSSVSPSPLSSPPQADRNSKTAGIQISIRAGMRNAFRAMEVTGRDLPPKGRKFTLLGSCVRRARPPWTVPPR
jgi:hypothetical protein